MTDASEDAASRVDAPDLDGLEPCPPVGRRSRTTSARAGAAREGRTARYVTRPALATGAVTIREGGRVDVATPLGACANSAPRPRHFVARTGVVRPPDPQSDATSLTLDALDFVHAVVTQIPDAREHLVRYYGAYSHRRCAAVGAKNGAADALAVVGTPAASAAPEPVKPAEPGSPEAKRRSAWARVLKKVFEVDPLVCAKCGGEMKVVAWITDRVVIDRILAHRVEAGLESPFEARGTPVTG